MSQAFPSKYLKAADLENRRFTLTMGRVEMESINENEHPKPVLYFQGAEKGMVLNQTNGMMIASLYGDDTDNWPGQAVELYTAIVQFQGQSVPAIRIMAPPNTMPAHQSLNSPLPASPAPDQAPSPVPGGSGHAPGDLDDSIPFGPCIY
ncbi:MAG: hypothetical protein ACR2RF_06040 [Geminicoccaceae bacterium]